MDDPFLVRRFEPVRNLDKERHGLIDRKWNALTKGLPFGQLHDEELFAFMLLETMKGRNVRVVQLRKQVSFTFKP